MDRRSVNRLCKRDQSVDADDFEYELTWPTIVNNEVRWVPYISLSPEPDIVDNFANIVQLTDSGGCDQVCSTSSNSEKPCRVTDRTRPSFVRPKSLHTNSATRAEKYVRKPAASTNFTKRFQNGANMQICFMNETILDDNGPSNETGAGTCVRPVRPVAVCDRNKPLTLQQLQSNFKDALIQCQQDVFVRFQNVKRNRCSSPIEDMIRNSFDRLNLEFPANKKRITRPILTEITNVTYLQILFNDLRQQIDTLNESLVRLLIEKDGLSMRRDSLLVDIVDYEKQLKDIETNFDCTKKSVESKRTETVASSASAVAAIAPAAAAASNYLLGATTLKPRLEKLKSFVRI